MGIGLSLTRWTVWASFVTYVMALAVLSRRPVINASNHWFRCLWSCACFLLFLHVGFAFAFVYQWSHTAANDETARQTAALVGIRSGFGLYVNYLMMAAWLVHVILQWTMPHRLHGSLATANRCAFWFFGFMWFNATVVFGDDFIRWLAVACGAMLAWRSSMTQMRIHAR